jgi:hypothetical protein
MPTLKSHIIAIVILFFTAIAVSAPPPKETSKIYDRLIQIVVAKCNTCSIIPIFEFPAYCGVDFHVDSSFVVCRPGYEGVINMSRKTGIAMVAIHSLTIKEPDTTDTYIMYFYKLYDQNTVWKECQKPVIIINGKCPR